MLGTEPVELNAKGQRILDTSQLFAVSGEGNGFGETATEIGFVLLPVAVAASLAGPVSGW
ncbi:hypothetical protein ABZ348_03000 [Streptomyces sp. NPDC005963]|uniref:hypothetical protein n=1 Tax=Streptomyces sp. NPDC005963 TaxID=3156721 RepID=UPI0033ED1638